MQQVVSARSAFGQLKHLCQCCVYLYEKDGRQLMLILDGFVALGNCITGTNVFVDTCEVPSSFDRKSGCRYEHGMNVVH